MRQKLRFPEFEGEWSTRKIVDILERVSVPVKVKPEQLYYQIGIRSHGKGLFHKEPVDGATLGSKRVFWVNEDALIINIVFGWEQAVAKTTSNERGMIASHRFPMFQPKNNLVNIDYLLLFLLTPKGKLLLESASPGGAGRNKTLGQKEFERSTLEIPSLAEQTKIASFLTSIDDKLSQLKKKKALLEEYKKGMMQKIFSREVRFRNGDEEFGEWEEKFLEDVSEIQMGQSPDSKSYNANNVGTPLVQGNADIQDRKTEPRFWTSEPTKLSEIGDIIMTVRAPVGAIAICQHFCCIGRGVCSIRGKVDIRNGYLYQYLLFIENKWGAIEQGSTFTAVTGNDVKKLKLPLPSILEQTKIAQFLSALDDKINLVSRQITQTEGFKKGLLQQMFV